MESLMGIPWDIFLSLIVILLTIAMCVKAFLTARKNAREQAAKQKQG